LDCEDAKRHAKRDVAEQDWDGDAENVA